MRKLVRTVLVSLATTAMAAALLASPASASPIGDAEAAIMAAWEKAGGDTSPLGARKGDVYPVADGFALDFDGGKMYYTTATGAKFLMGPILDKYESLGGPSGDLGFPTINEVPGLAGPDSRVSTFAAIDKPVIFWTPDHGAFVVRGAMNAAWDKLGSSGGVLGAPVADETYDGEVTTQKFSGGQVSWNRQTKAFTTDPAALADQLTGLQVVIDPTAAIDTAWRAAGGPNGPLGAKQGGQYPVGSDGTAQNFAGGKVFFSPATGANAVESDILAKYESLGGPVGSDLGFPVDNESDGGLAPSSRVCTFSASDKPVIFWTPDHGAFVVRGAMKVAWDKLRGPTGKLGAPVGDQAVDGDVISQRFAGGKISWNRSNNTFSTDPPNLAPLLSGLQVSGQGQPSNTASPPHAKKFTWHWWWLAAIPVLALLAMLALVAFGWRRRRAGEDGATQLPDRDVDAAGYDAGYDAGGAAPDERWGREDAETATENFGPGDVHPMEQQPSEAGPAGRVSWSRGTGPEEGAAFAPQYGGAEPHRRGEPEFEQEDPDAVDTDSIPIVSAVVPEVVSEVVPEVVSGDVPEVVSVDYWPGAGYHPIADAHPDATYAESAREGEYPDSPDEAEAHPDGEQEVADGHPDEAVPHMPPEAAAAETAGAHASDDAASGGAASAPERRTGRHAAVDDGDASENGGDSGDGAHGRAARPTIHLPLDDPYQVPEGYPIKASARFGLYYTPGSELYHDTLPEIWLASEEVAQANGFIKAD